MMAGDAYSLPIKISSADGTANASTFADVEVCIGHVRKTLADGEITFDTEQECFLVPLTQEETFSLRGRAKINIRCKYPSGDVVGIDLGTLDFGPSLSKEVI